MSREQFLHSIEPKRQRTGGRATCHSLVWHHAGLHVRDVLQGRDFITHHFVVGHSRATFTSSKTVILEQKEKKEEQAVGGQISIRECERPCRFQSWRGVDVRLVGVLDGDVDNQLVRLALLVVVRYHKHFTIE